MPGSAGLADSMVVPKAASRMPLADAACTAAAQHRMKRAETRSEARCLMETLQDNEGNMRHPQVKTLCAFLAIVASRTAKVDEGAAAQKPVGAASKGGQVGLPTSESAFTSVFPLFLGEQQ